MKKILAFMLLVVMVLSFSGCMPSSSKAPKIPTVTDPATADEVAYTSYEDSLRGVCEYMEAKGFIYALPEATGDELTDPHKMDAAFIGADEGYKFTYTYDKKVVTVEIYSFSNTDGQHYQQAKSEGKVTIAEDIQNGTVNATLSGNGKYMMMYTDAGERTEREAKAVEAFKAFGK